MDELFKSFARLGLATSLWGVQQLQKTLTPFTAAGLIGLKPGGFIPDSFRNYLSQPMASAISEMLAADSLAPRGMMKTAVELMRSSAEIFKTITAQGDYHLAWSEFQNKLLSFYLFENIDSTLDISPNARPSLPEIVGKTSRLGPFLSVWATEGVGHYVSDWHFAQGQLPTQLLSSPEAQALSTASMIPLHAGVGLSLAEASFRETSRSDEVPSLIATFVERCQDSARKGFLGEAYEALGLACRTLYPHLVGGIDRQLALTDEALLAYFWHGVGRAIYFAPTNVLPVRNAPWAAALQACSLEPPHALGRRNAASGFAWALTLVNMRQPEVMAGFLRQHVNDISASDAFSNGICSAAIAWHDSAPGDEDLDPFRNFQPGDRHETDLWKKYVKASCDDALRYHSVITQHDALGEIFRYQNLPEFIRNLECANRNSSAANAQDAR